MGAIQMADRRGARRLDEGKSTARRGTRRLDEGKRAAMSQSELIRSVFKNIFFPWSSLPHLHCICHDGTDQVWMHLRWRIGASRTGLGHLRP